jgi:hypothetical protein
MTLKQKFETKSSIDTTKEAKVFAKECEDIADNFAIGFAEWVLFNCDEFPKQDQELILRIYKKECNL